MTTKDHIRRIIDHWPPAPLALAMALTIAGVSTLGWLAVNVAEAIF